MKRIAFLFIGIAAITVFVFSSQKEAKSIEIVKTDVKKHTGKNIYN